MEDVLQKKGKNDKNDTFIFNLNCDMNQKKINFEKNTKKTRVRSLFHLERCTEIDEISAADKYLAHKSTFFLLLPFMGCCIETFCDRIRHVRCVKGVLCSHLNRYE